jgi:hypothetical protein
MDGSELNCELTNDHCELIIDRFSLASCDRREDAQDITLPQYLILLSMNAIDQNDLGYLFGYLEPGQNILNTGRIIDLHLTGKPAASLREIISKRSK